MRPFTWLEEEPPHLMVVEQSEQMSALLEPRPGPQAEARVLAQRDSVLMVALPEP